MDSAAVATSQQYLQGFSGQPRENWLVFLPLFLTKSLLQLDFSCASLNGYRRPYKSKGESKTLVVEESSGNTSCQHKMNIFQKSWLSFYIAIRDTYIDLLQFLLPGKTTSPPNVSRRRKITIVIISEHSLPSHGYDLLWSQSIFTYIIPYPLYSRPVRSLIIKTSEVRRKNPELSQDF